MRREFLVGCVRLFVFARERERERERESTTKVSITSHTITLRGKKTTRRNSKFIHKNIHKIELE